jgi:hypothetical protein
MSDWHICLHSPFGTKLHTLLALLISEQIQSETGLKIEAFPIDNGILLHTPGGTKPPQINWASLLSPNLRDRIAQLISTTSLFGITFRHCAQRSLVMALLAYGKRRTPLWLSRLKASDLLQVVSLESLILPARWHSHLAPHFDQILGSGLISWRAKQIGKELFLRFEPGFAASDHLAIPTWVGCPVYSENFLSGVQLSHSAERLVQTLQGQGALNLFQLSTVLDQSVSRVWSDLTELMVSGMPGLVCA